MNIALIPARAGSKGLPGKNTRLIKGKPCVQYTFDSAIGADIFDKVAVSTDDRQVSEIANCQGITVIDRPSLLCRDESTAADVVHHAIKALDLEGDTNIYYLQPTSPLRTAAQIVNASHLFESQHRPVISVRESTELPYKMFRISGDGLLPLFSERHTNMRRQDLPVTYLANGAIYIFKVSSFLKADGFPSLGGHPFIMDYESSLDLDAKADLIKIEHILEERQKNADS